MTLTGTVDKDGYVRLEEQVVLEDKERKKSDESEGKNEYTQAQWGKKEQELQGKRADLEERIKKGYSFLPE